MSYIKIMLANDLSRLDTAVRYSLDDTFRMNPLFTLNRHSWNPHTDIFETEHEIEILCDLAGVKLEDIHVETDRRTLRIFGIRRESKRRHNGRYLLAEIPSGYFERSFSLSVPVDMERIEAKYADGLLQIRLEKLTLSNIQRITVRTI
jgi:HSP20 family protein